MTYYRHPVYPPVGAVVVVTVTDIQLTVRAQDAQRALLITQTASIDITVAAHHRQTIGILLIGSQSKDTGQSANSLSLSKSRRNGH